MATHRVIMEMKNKISMMKITYPYLIICAIVGFLSGMAGWKLVIITIVIFYMIGRKIEKYGTVGNLWYAIKNYRK